jgi:hypothetical protein
MKDKRKSLKGLFAALLILWGTACVREAGAPDFNQQDTAAQVAEVKSEIAAAKQSLAHDGKYECCIKPPCDWCVTKANGCACASMVDADQPVCPECGLGWKQGKGSLEGIAPEEVKNVLEN